MNLSTDTPNIAFEEITPERALAWLEHNNLENRPVRAANVRKLVADMSAGNYIVTGDSIKFDWNGRLIDGQHRLRAIVEHGKPVLIAVALGLDPRVQVVIDAGARRSGSDALKFAGLEKYRTTVASMARLDYGVRGIGGASATSLRVYAEVTNAQITQWWEENPDAEAAAIDGTGWSRTIGTGSPSSMAYAVMVLRRIDPDAVEEFFESMVQMRTEGKGDPRFTLVRFLGGLGDSARGDTKAAQTFYAVVRAWNAWRNGESLGRIAPTSRGEARAIPEPI